jgi:DNA-binding CsgD family transcriptional regulator
MCTGRLETALGEAERRVRTAADPVTIAGAETIRAEVLALQGRAGSSEAIQRALSLLSATGNTFFEANYNASGGRIRVSQGHPDGYQVLETATAKLESWGLFAMCVENRAVLAEAAVQRGDLVNARRHLHTPGWQLPRANDPAGAPVLRAEAWLARAEGQLDRAHALACDGLEAAFHGGHVLWTVDLLELVAIAWGELGHLAEAARLLGAAEGQRDLTGYVRPAPARDQLAPVMTELKNALGQVRFDQAVSEGKTLTLEEAVVYARRRRGSRSRARYGWDSLTSSERRVASLVGEHLTNAEIAERLCVSTATVKSHLNRVFAKLAVANRGQLASEAHSRERP